jgi:hypothetical protein
MWTPSPAETAIFLARVAMGSFKQGAGVAESRVVNLVNEEQPQPAA